MPRGVGGRSARVATLNPEITKRGGAEISGRARRARRAQLCSWVGCGFRVTAEDVGCQDIARRRRSVVGFCRPSRPGCPLRQG